MNRLTILLTMILAMLLASPARAQSPTGTPFPTPTMQCYSRATLMAGIGVKPYHILETTPFAMQDKVIGQVPEGASWFTTFTFLMAENGALLWLSAVFISLLVVFILLAILSHIRRSGPVTDFRENVETKVAQAKERGYARAGGWYTDVKEAQSMLKSAPWKKGRGR